MPATLLIRMKSDANSAMWNTKR